MWTGSYCQNTVRWAKIQYMRLNLCSDGEKTEGLSPSAETFFEIWSIVAQVHESGISNGNKSDVSSKFL
jgi:hypothetical protein